MHSHDIAKICRLQIQSRQAMYVERNIEARTCNCVCSGKAIRITYSEWACSLSYLACNAHGSCHLWLAPLYTMFPHCLINDMILEKKVI